MCNIRLGLIEASGDYMGLAGNAFEVGPGGTTYPEGAGSPGQPAGGVPSAEKYAPDAASRLAVAASYKLLLPLVPDLCPAQLGCLHLHEQSRARHTVNHT